MRWLVIAVLVVVSFATPAFARPRRTNNSTYSAPAPVESRMTYTTAEFGDANNGSAQGVAELQARCGQCKHFGGNSGMMEGVGFSTTSPEDAIRRCCFYGRIRIFDQGVARGQNGWYACIRGR